MPDRKCKMWHKNQRFKIENRRETYLQMHYQKSKIWHKNVLPGISHLHFNLVSCIFRVSHFTSRILYFLLAHFSRQLGTSQPCISHVISHTLHSFNLASHIFLFHSFASYISHLMFFMPHNVTYVYVYDICMTHVIDIFIDTYDIWHIWLVWHMCYILYDTYVIDTFIDICHMSTSKSHARGGTRYIPG